MASKNSPETEETKSGLSLFDAVNIALGTIIGAGIFVIIGAATALAGPAVFLSVMVAAVVSLLTGLTTAELSKRYPRSGGAYKFAREIISNSAGFIVGFVWLFSNTITGATVAVGFGHYLKFFIPAVPTKFGAAFIVAAAIFIQLLGTKESSKLNNILVVFKVCILLFFIAGAVSFFKLANFKPLLPFGISGVWAGAATVFFAYSGFARVSVIADEIKDPSKTVPRATLISIFISTLIYILVAVAAVGVAGYQIIAKSGSPLADAMKVEGLNFGANLVGAGALVATGTVILASILGVSRLAQTMAQDRELPVFFSRIDPKKSAPRNAIVLSGALMILIGLFADLPHIAYISSFSLLLYYAAIDFSGLKIFRRKRRTVALLGLCVCLMLMFSLPYQSWLIGLAVVLIGALYYRLCVQKARPQNARK
jgi:basic amino acid/polyamine antiporter, APA family